jgi:hypothetical protein
MSDTAYCRMHRREYPQTKTCPDCDAGAPATNALGQPSPGRTDFTLWDRGNLERFARQAADENLVLRTQLRNALDAWRTEVKKGAQRG